MRYLSFLLWRRSRNRVRRAAAKLISERGETALLGAHEAAWAAQGENDRRQALFWQAVCGEIGRQLKRNQLLASLLSPAPRHHKPEAVVLTFAPPFGQRRRHAAGGERP